MRRTSGSPSPVPPSRVVKKGVRAFSNVSWTHAFAVVDDGDHETALVPRCPHCDVPARRRRLKGVQHQVEDGLLELEAVEPR